MNIKRLINALEKAGLTVEKIDCHEYKKAIGHYKEPFWKYTCVSATHKCDFFPNGKDNEGNASEDCCSVQVMRKNERNDSQSDYFPGSFCSTIKAVVSHMKGDWL